MQVRCVGTFSNGFLLWVSAAMSYVELMKNFGNFCERMKVICWCNVGVATDPLLNKTRKRLEWCLLGAGGSAELIEQAKMKTYGVAIILRSLEDLNR